MDIYDPTLKLISEFISSKRFFLNDLETKIKDLIYLILKISKVDKKIIFDTTKAEGQPRRNCDTTLLKKVVGFKTEYDIEKGLEETIEFYKKNYLKNE